MIALSIEPRFNWGKKGGTAGKNARPFVDGFFISRTESRSMIDDNVITGTTRNKLSLGRLEK